MAEITPKAEFVLKTKSFVDYKSLSAGAKVFVNICSNEKIEKSKDEIESIEEVLRLVEDKDWIIPIVLSVPRVTKFKDTNCLVFDAIINPIYINWCLINEKFKIILGYWVCNIIEDQQAELFVNREEVKFLKRTSIDEPRVICSKNEEIKAKEIVENELEETNIKESNLIQTSNIVEKQERNEIVISSSNQEKTSIENGIESLNNIVAKESKIIKTQNPFSITTVKLSAQKTIYGYQYLIKLKSKYKHEFIFNRLNNELMIKSNELPQLNYQLPNGYKIKRFSVFELKNTGEIHIYL